MEFPDPDKRLLAEEAHENSFGLPMMEVLARMLPVAACLSEVKPVGCLVAGSGKAASIDKRLRYEHRVAVDMHPVLGKTAQIKAQNP
jgi:hypothetical protein